VTTKTPTHNWTAERLSAQDLAALKVIRENAERKGATDLISMCDTEISRRKPATSPRAKRSIEAETGDLVTEYHYVCRNDRGVTFNPDGTFWSASWVVAEDVLQKSLKFGAKLALHNSKAEPSYRQGAIKEYRTIDDFADGEVTSRIDFLVLPDEIPLVWAGSGTGERGYKRVKSTGMAAISDPIEGNRT
jgi:hypothetical protein